MHTTTRDLASAMTIAVCIVLSVFLPLIVCFLEQIRDDLRKLNEREK